MRGFIYAWNGLRVATASQRNFKFELVCAALAIGISSWLRLAPLEWAILFLTLAGVLAGELLNTSLETTLNLISREQHPEIGLAKDLAAAAVLIWSIFALCIGACLWGPKLLALLPA